MASVTVAVCKDCASTLPRALRCPDCGLTRAEDGTLPPGARLVRY